MQTEVLINFVAEPHESTGFHATKFPYLSFHTLCETYVHSVYRLDDIEFNQALNITTIHFRYGKGRRQTRLLQTWRHPFAFNSDKLPKRLPQHSNDGYIMWNFAVSNASCWRINRR
ncbi:hypothetical protein K2Y11_07870 [bacterium]|nr:hypothetical protein [bacterium]